MWATTLVAAASGSAQSQTCAAVEQVFAISAIVDEMRPTQRVAELPRALLPVEDVREVQWCVDSEDPRCAPDPAGAPAAHLQHAGDVGQAARDLVIAPAPAQGLARSERTRTRAAQGCRKDLERPPQRG